MADDSPPYHMTPEQFRQAGQQLLDWITSYYERLESLPVAPQTVPGAVRGSLPPSPPQQPEPFAAVLADVEQHLLPALLHWQSPRFFGYFPANVSGPSILAELLSAALGQQGMLWSTSPAATELETLMLDWLIELCDLPQTFHSSTDGGGVLQDSASSAILCAVVAARYRALARRTDSSKPSASLVAYASPEAHSSIDKALRIAGLGPESLSRVAVDEQRAMRPDDLEGRLESDRSRGRVPFFVCATVGTTSSNAMDPLRALGEITRRHGVWLHVDAAMSGTAAVCPEFRYLFDGLEHADSYCFNPHKWMFTNFDCSAFWVSDRGALTESLSVVPEFLRNPASESGQVIDYRDWQIPLGRRFRALKLWFVLRHYGVEGLRHHIRRHVSLAQWLVATIRADPRFELLAPVPLNLICFRLRASDATNQELLDRLNQSGQLFLTHTRLEGRLTLRLVVGQTHTERRHLEAAWQQIAATAESLLSAEEPGPTP